MERDGPARRDAIDINDIAYGAMGPGSGGGAPDDAPSLTLNHPWPRNCPRNQHIHPRVS